MSENQEQFGDRTEEATPRKKEEFRKKGDIAVSRDLGSSFSLVSVALVLPFAGKFFYENAAMLMRSIMSGKEVGPYILGCVFGMVAPFIISALLSGLIAGLIQTKFLWAPSRLSPDIMRIFTFSRVSKVFFSKNTIVEIIKSILKVVLLAGILYWTSADAFKILPTLNSISIYEIVQVFLYWLLKMVFAGAGVAILLGMIDYIWTRFQMNQRMKMSLKEVRDENKEQEGDPFIRGRREKLHRDLSFNRIIEAVPEADMLVVNPTHFAVALRYRRGLDNGPKVTAKGQDVLALKMRSLARSNNIPVFEYPSLARSIYKTTKVGQDIASDHYGAVARLFAFIYRNRAAQGGV